MIQFDDEELAQLMKGEDHLTEKYGALGTKSSEGFNARALCYYKEVLSS